MEGPSGGIELPPGDPQSPILPLYYEGQQKQLLSFPLLILTDFRCVSDENLPLDLLLCKKYFSYEGERLVRCYGHNCSYSLDRSKLSISIQIGNFTIFIISEVSP